MAGTFFFALSSFIFPAFALATGGDAAPVCSQKDSCLTTQSSPLLQTSKAKVSPHLKEVDSESQQQSLGEVTEHTIQQKSTMHYLDAYPNAAKDYGAAMRLAQEDDSQKWLLTKVGNNEYTIQQKDTMRYLDAWPYQSKDYRVCTREEQGDDSQRWIITKVDGDDSTITQKMTDRVWDAYESAYYDYAVVTRENKADPTQLWVITPPLSSPDCQSDIPNFWTNKECKWTCRKGGNLTQDQKCALRDECDGCPNCLCKDWCDTSTKSWSQKCKFDSCSKCSCCNEE